MLPASADTVDDKRRQAANIADQLERLVEQMEQPQLVASVVLQGIGGRHGAV
jgi:hypothetical protein